ncbi:DUF6884 domain-containing protein [Nocardioides sp. Soil805]|uniref:DUF6884 domain-containing protein n=1 Tax=Nocardioides sp. Soil805 TaxID=1736416 RepID=UPI000702933B|nr:DUF6884 domain-containing protein [Nocardioides sp. Soil805]KRF37396.1 hypothetical protein ASG94_08725 [Nocardioides sp. Soil805]
MADWRLLIDSLDTAGDSVRYTWDELETLVGGLPASATNHRAWWSGDRPHVNTWRSAGFTVTDLVPGREVRFTRVGIPKTGTPTTTGEAAVADAPAAPDGQPPTLLLVACVKEKLPAPAAARDLYVSPLFKKEREYAERVGLPWFILSAEHGLVVPDEWLSPYERYLPETPPSFRRAWGTWVVERLELLSGSLAGRTIEVHAGATYVDVLGGPFASKGASVYAPLAGLRMGQRLAWYDAQAGLSHARNQPDDVHAAANDFCKRLADDSAAVDPGEFIAHGPSSLTVPGLYSWWVDLEGAVDLSAGLGLPLEPGLIYAGLAGATRWPSGRPSSNTLWSRITGMHLGGRHEFSTFRRTLGCILANARHEPQIDEVRLTAWMYDHLKVVAVPYEEPDTLGKLEGDVLNRIDPPLNLQGMASTATRRRLKELRRPHARGRVRSGTRGADQRPGG